MVKEFDGIEYVEILWQLLMFGGIVAASTTRELLSRKLSIMDVCLSPDFIRLSIFWILKNADSCDL